jgi:hypothetical protein
MTINLDQVLDLLNKHHQRATYGAVAAVVGGHAQSVLQGRDRDWRHSWVVNRESGLPTKYPKGMIHPSIEHHERILSTGEELRAWLERSSD